MHVGTPQQPDKLEFAGMPECNTFPRGEGAPVRTLGRMRNGDLFRICMHFVKKGHSSSTASRSPFPPGQCHQLKRQGAVYHCHCEERSDVAIRFLLGNMYVTL